MSSVDFRIFICNLHDCEKHSFRSCATAVNIGNEERGELCGRKSGVWNHGPPLLPFTKHWETLPSLKHGVIYEHSQLKVFSLLKILELVFQKLVNGWFWISSFDMYPMLFWNLQSSCLSRLGLLGCTTTPGFVWNLVTHAVQRPFSNSLTLQNFFVFMFLLSLSLGNSKFTLLIKIAYMYILWN